MGVLLVVSLCVSAAAFALLEVPDLGGGVLSLLFRGEEGRFACLRPALPLRDGAELWLLLCAAVCVFGAPAFAAAMGSVFPVHLILLALLAAVRLLAAKLRLNSLDDAASLRWDRVRSVCGVLFLFVGGTLLATLLRGAPVDADGRFSGQISVFFHPYALLGGTAAVLSSALFAIPAALRSEGEFRAKLLKLQSPLWLASLFVSAAFLGWTIAFPRCAGAFRGAPVWIALFPAVLGLAQLSALLQSGRFRAARVSALVSVAGHAALFFALLFPDLMPSVSGNPMETITLAGGLAGKTVLGTAAPCCAGALLLLGFWSIFTAVRSRKEWE